MEEEKNAFHLPFKLKAITTREFATDKDAFLDAEQEVTLKYTLSFGIDIQETTISVLSKCTFLQNEKAFIICGVSCLFDIQPQAWEKQITADKKKISFPRQFAEHLAVLTTSTLRGVLHTKLENSEFSNFILPNIDISKLVPADKITFDLKP